MSDTNASPTTPEPNADLQPVACSTGCPCQTKGLLRAVLYAPVVLIVGAFGAVAMFPNLADYASPLIGDSASKGYEIPAACYETMNRMTCASQQTPASCTSEDAAAEVVDHASCSASEMPFSCCPGSRVGVSFTKEVTAEDVNSLDSASSRSDVPADAFSALNDAISALNTENAENF